MRNIFRFQKEGNNTATLFCGSLPLMERGVTIGPVPKFQHLKTSASRGNFYRKVSQWGFLFWCVYIGIRFGIFVHLYRIGSAPGFSRPPSVEAFLPIGSLVGLKNLFITGVIHPVHPAGVVLLVTFFGMSLAAKKSFCSFICPVGTLSEQLWKGGEKLFGRIWHLPAWVDIPLRSAKYLLLYFFIIIILFKMPVAGILPFLNGPYWAVADVKMLDFFVHISSLAAGVILILAALSLPMKNFWCRYLCPYGALVGLLSLASPWKIRRNHENCTECGSCAQACPSHLPVNRKKVIRSVECTGCLTCVSNCPGDEALAMSLPFWENPLPAWAFPSFVLFLFALGVGWGMATGHWQTTLTPADYRTLIPLAPLLSH